MTIGPTYIAAPEVAMTMNRPFFYAIRDDQTGSLLLAGLLLDPNT